MENWQIFLNENRLNLLDELERHYLSTGPEPTSTDSPLVEKSSEEELIETKLFRKYG